MHERKIMIITMLKMNPLINTYKYSNHRHQSNTELAEHIAENSV